MPATKTTAKKPAKKVFIDEQWEAIEKGFVRLQKSQDEAWAAIRETQAAHKETEKAIRETQKNLGGLGNTVGSIVERIMTVGLPKKFKPFGFTFDKVTTVKWASGKTVYAEIDGLLENGSQAMVVEVKSKLEHIDVTDHLERMERVRKYADEHNDQRQFFGAIAATVASIKNREYALSQGLYFIEPSGEDVKVTKPTAEPRVW